ncbi:uncharacterized protein BDZ83DRAFT_204897 [Colletotrichum acutatum]|uniref:Uncharacterized protein n=1 Tax=Glomerella acutata TaxID=27357 RepID=A0AAD8UTF1_GLOAC|nr:uncharacterized protein BDZ83DRAFT_204897 [Colletotrichum acutatum]KAK1727444.1 hypothetical protein BDZ83DRAFT_204897 [Colletotrichum acutatum]
MTGSGPPPRLPTTSILSREKMHIAVHERQKKKRSGGFRPAGASSRRRQNRRKCSLVLGLGRRAHNVTAHIRPPSAYASSRLSQYRSGYACEEPAIHCRQSRARLTGSRTAPRARGGIHPADPAPISRQGEKTESVHALQKASRVKFPGQRILANEWLRKPCNGCWTRRLQPSTRYISSCFPIPSDLHLVCSFFASSRCTMIECSRFGHDRETNDMYFCRASHDPDELLNASTATSLPTNLKCNKRVSTEHCSQLDALLFSCSRVVHGSRCHSVDMNAMRLR